MNEITPIINAAGKLTSLGGSAQSKIVAESMASAAMEHVDLKSLREIAGRRIADLTGAEAACVTTGAAAGIVIAVAAILTGSNTSKIQMLPDFEGENRFLLQAGHAINFGAPIEQMIRLGGGDPVIIGSTNSVSKKLLADRLTHSACAGFVFVQSHHCVQENMLGLDSCIEFCHKSNIPFIVDAAAEEDLTKYISAGADLVTYSGGKAFAGPTSGFIAGRKDLIAACEMQFAGIARTMKVGKEQIMALLTALDLYVVLKQEDRLAELNQINSLLMEQLAMIASLGAYLKDDEAGREFSRVAITVNSAINSAAEKKFNIRDLVAFLAAGSPSIRTRNHHLDQGIVLIDPREITLEKAQVIADRIKEYAKGLS